MRRKTNIVRFEDCKKLPCKVWLERFENGQIDAHEAFKKYGENYDWLYANTDIDLIGWEIENNVFDWEEHSWEVARYCPQHLDPLRYNWTKYSGYVAQYCPDKLDPARYNWQEYSLEVAAYCADKLDPERYNWAEYSGYVAKYCPDKLDPLRYNWKDYSKEVEQFCPHLLTLKPTRNETQLSPAGLKEQP